MDGGRPCEQVHERVPDALARLVHHHVVAGARRLVGDERDRARFAKARSYMIRREDIMACKNMRCRKRFEISGVQSVVFTE